MFLIVDVEDARVYKNPLPRFRPRAQPTIDYILGLVDYEEE